VSDERILRIMKTNVRDVATIVHRHRQDAVEDGRTCRACGNPWPCDVRLIAVALEAGAKPQAARLTSVATTPSSAASRASLTPATRSRAHRAPQAKSVPA
jgi:hypothetical protein